VTVQKLFLTFLGSGLSPKAPGTVAAVISLLTGLAILRYMGMETLFMLAFAVTIIGIFEINKYGELTGKYDQPYIVIDKAVGMWLSLMIASSTAATMNYPYVDGLAIILSFAAFRLFDTWKPSTIGWIAREVKGGLGIMMDDVVSGIAGGFLAVVILMGVERLF